MEPRANYIDGRWVDSPERVQNINPSRTSDAAGDYAWADGGSPPAG